MEYAAFSISIERAPRHPPISPGIAGSGLVKGVVLEDLQSTCHWQRTPAEDKNPRAGIRRSNELSVHFYTISNISPFTFRKVLDNRSWYSFWCRFCTRFNGSHWHHDFLMITSYFRYLKFQKSFLSWFDQDRQVQHPYVLKLSIYQRVRSTRREICLQFRLQVALLELIEMLTHAFQTSKLRAVNKKCLSAVVITWRSRIFDCVHQRSPSKLKISFHTTERRD